jgi:hypothetical protein
MVKQYRCFPEFTPLFHDQNSVFRELLPTGNSCALRWMGSARVEPEPLRPEHAKERPFA